MDGPVENETSRAQQPKNTNSAALFEQVPKNIRFFEQIKGGPDNGFFRTVPPTILEGRTSAYSKAFFKTPIKGAYRDLIPFYKGFYYIPRQDDIPVRRMMFGLQHYDMPKTGNVEEYIKRFNYISIPKNYCPIVEPCFYDWCRDCQELRKVESTLQKEGVGIGILNVLYIFFTFLIIAGIVILAFFI